MKSTGVTANLSVPDITVTRDFYSDYLGLNDVGSRSSTR